jgi:hypothetical protein
LSWDKASNISGEDVARKRLALSLPGADSYGQVPLARIRTNLAEFFLSAGNPGESEALVRQSMPVFQEAKSKDDETWANAVLARGYWLKARPTEPRASAIPSP